LDNKCIIKVLKDHAIAQEINEVEMKKEVPLKLQQNTPNTTKKNNNKSKLP
jgi:hypothetical protein